MKVSAESWNRFVDRIFRSRIVSVTAEDAKPWRHPWTTRFGWSDRLGAFAMQVKPGFCVSGEPSGRMRSAVTARVPYEFAPAGTLARLEAAGDRSREGVVDAWLREGPTIPLPSSGIWRAVGTDAEPFGEVEKVPKFFRKRGVNPAPKGQLDAFGITVTDGVANDGYPIHAVPRLLRACDVVLHHDRLANATDWQRGSGVEGTIAQFRVGPTSRPGRRELPYLRVVRRYAPPLVVDPVAYLLGGVEDAGTDSVKIATLYLLSEVGAASGSEPESAPLRWAAHVRHHVQWDLRYVTSRFVAGTETLPLEVPGLELAGGALLTLAPLTAAANDAYAQALAFVTTRLVEGRFVTF